MRRTQDFEGRSKARSLMVFSNQLIFNNKNQMAQLLL